MLARFLKFLVGLLCGSPQGSQDTPQRPDAHIPHPHPGRKQEEGPGGQDNEYYVSLRAQANEHGDEMARCFQRSHEAYAKGDGALAKELSNQGKEHQRKMEQLNKQASDYIFRENNKDCQPGEIDLHGLYVKEAIARADAAIIQAKAERQHQVKFIVGKGLHSQGGVAKIKPAIEELMRKHQLSAQLDPTNAGVLIVMIDSHQGGIGPDEISRRLTNQQEGCTVM